MDELRVEFRKEDLPSGENDGFIVDAQEVINKLTPEQSFLLAKKEIQSVIDCIHDGICIVDGDGKLLMINEASRKGFHAKEADEFIGLNVKEMVARGHWSESICLEVMKQQKPVSKIQIVKGMEILCTCIPYFTDGKIVRIVATDRYVYGLEELQKSLREARKTLELYQSGLEYYRRQNAPKNVMIVKSPNMSALIDTALRIAKQDVTVLIQGESGTGKEVLADLIYSNSLRSEGPYIKINCAAMAESLIESELFGYEKGAFTGADQKGKVGIFELANGGTIFLDEIGEMSLNTQTKLLRVLQESEIMRVGGRESVSIDVRIIAATNANLYQLMLDGKFREDLYYRLNIIPFHIPALRERREDIPEMTRWFLESFNKKYKTQAEIDSNTLELFAGYDWPGNIRELKNVVERLIVTGDGEYITYGQVARQLYGDSTQSPPKETEYLTLPQKVDLYERQMLESALGKSRSCAEAARILGISKSAMSKKMKKYGIETEKCFRLETVVKNGNA